MKHYNLPERFRAGDFVILEEEYAILRELVDNFYASVEANVYVTLEDFTELMDFIDVLRDADTEEVQLILCTALMRSTEICKSLPNHVNLYE